MRLFSWLRERIGAVGRIGNPSHRPRRSKSRPTPRARLRLEVLEDRYLPSTLTVTNNLNSGAGSLRNEIAAAHNGDTIVFAPSLDGQTITLTSGELLIKKNLTIAGPGAGQLTISGNNASRVFEVAKNETVTLSGLTISNGLTVNYGGGIINHGVLTVSNDTLSGNGSYSGNSGVDGGGIYNDGTLTVSGSTLSGNSGISGGGIFNQLAGTLTVSNCTVSANTGGGISNNGTATISGSTLSGNTVSGGIANSGSLTVSGSTLSNNTSTDNGGGISNGPNGITPGTLTVSNCTLTGNSCAGVEGGGIFSVGTLTLSGSTLSANVAPSYGGGVFCSGTATLTNDTLTSNTTSAIGYGGGLYIASAGSTVYLDASTVANVINNRDSSGLNGATANIDGSYTVH